MTVLPEVEATLRDAVRRHHRDQAKARRLGFGGAAHKLDVLQRSRLRLVGAGVLAAALVGVVTVIATGNLTGRPSAQLAPRSAQVLPAALRADFVSLRTARSMSDALPSDIVAALAHERIGGIDVSQSRLLLNSQTNPVWLVPGPKETCLVLRRSLSGPIARTAIPSACSPNSVVEQSGIVSISGSMIAAVLPDGSSPVTITLRDGSRVQLTPNSDGAIAQNLAQPPSRLSYAGPDGTPHTIAVPTPTPPPGPQP